MAKKKGLGPVKRFGPRYGRTVKYRRAKIEREQYKNHKCPYCSKERVGRIAYGIWHCRKCDSTFTGRAYTVAARYDLVQKKEDLVAVAPVFKSKVVEDNG